MRYRAPRGVLRRSIILAFAAAIATSMQPAGATSVDWPQFAQGPAHTGYQPLETVIGPDSVGELSPAWVRDLTPYGGQRQEIYAASVVAGGTVFAAPMRVRAAHGSLFALDAATGQVRWRTTDIGTLVAAPAVLDGIVVVNASYPHEAIAFDAATGETLWRQPTVLSTGWEGENFEGTSPVLVDGIAVVSASGDTLEGEPLGRLWAFDLETGEVVWDARQTHGRPTVAGGKVLVADWTWSGTVWDGRQLVARDLLDGSIVWKTSLGGPDAVVGIPSVQVGIVYVTVERRRSHLLVALDVSDGSELWRTVVHAHVGEFTPPVITPDRIVLASANGWLIGRHRHAGGPAWRAEVTARHRDTWTCVEGSCASPAAANGVVFAVAGPTIAAFRLSNGARLWHYEIGREEALYGNASSPAIASGVIYVGSYTGREFAFRPGR